MYKLFLLTVSIVYRETCRQIIVLHYCSVSTTSVIRLVIFFLYRHLHDAVTSEQKYQHLLTRCRSMEFTSNARKRLSFSVVTNDSISTAPSLSEPGSPPSSDFTAAHLAVSPSIHPETPCSPLSDGVFEDEGAKLGYRKASSAGIPQRISPFHYQLHSRG